MKCGLVQGSPASPTIFVIFLCYETNSANSIIMKFADDVSLVSFTVDPEYDNARVLAEYAQNYEADLERWKFVTGTREALWDLSKKGFKLDVGEDAKTAAMPI